MNIDNFDAIIEWLSNKEINEEDSYLQVELFQRAKDGNGSAKEVENTRSKAIKKYYPKNVEELRKIRDNVIDLCKKNNARAYIFPSFISKKKVYHILLKDLVEKITSNNYSKPVESLASSLASKGLVNSYFIIDIDTLDRDILSYYETYLQENNIKYCLNFTPNGYHIVSEGFNITKIEIKENVEFKSKNMTVLCYQTEK